MQRQTTSQLPPHHSASEMCLAVRARKKVATTFELLFLLKNEELQGGKVMVGNDEEVIAGVGACQLLNDILGSQKDTELSISITCIESGLSLIGACYLYRLQR